MLGPIEVHGEHEFRTPSAPMQRALLAILLLDANRRVSMEAIADNLWAGRPPKSAVAAVQVYVAGLRKLLSETLGVTCADPRSHPVLQTRTGGYAVRVPPDSLDVAEFRCLAERGRAYLAAGRCGEASECLRAALGQWRGPALDDVRRIGAVEARAACLERERLAVEQISLRADLCRRGRIDVAILELERLCRENPFHEGLLRDLMVGLARRQRRVEALEAYSRARRRMHDEIGIEPAAALRATHRAILDGATPELCHRCSS